jgi:hypothetical protein
VNEIFFENGAATIACEVGLACIGARAVAVENSTLSVVNAMRALTAHQVSVRNSSLVVQYEDSSSLEPVTDSPVLHFGEIAFIEELPGQTYEFTIANMTVKVDSSRVRSLLVSVPSVGNVSTGFRLRKMGISGSICWGPSNSHVFEVGGGESYFGHVRLCNYRKTMSPPLYTRSPAGEGQSQEGQIDSGIITRLSIAIGVFVVVVVGIILLAVLKNHCDLGSDNAASGVPVVSVGSGQTGEDMQQSLM